MNDLRLPPEDRGLSPCTGWTRAHWEAVADHWLLTARRHASPDGGLITPPGRPSAAGIRSDGIEGFARSFLTAAPLLAGRAEDPHDHAGWYARGLAAAMAPDGPDRWGRAIGVDEIKQWNGTPQPIVEAANLAFGLAVCRAQLWDRLDEKLRDQTADWLTHHAVKHGSDNNWLLFTAVIEAFLTSAGYDVPGGHAQEDVDVFESWYLGDGWYNDGPIGPTTGHGNRVDHYNSWVIHPFLWQWYQLSEQAVERREQYLRRLGEFADSYALLFAADGSPLHQGRSLTYRHAVLGGLWTAALAGVGSESAGATRRLASGVLRRFTVELGAAVDGPPSLGWSSRQFLPMCQVYSGPGSPYFAGMGFLGLAAPADHPLWTEPEQPQPSERADRGDCVRTLHAVGWVIRSGDGVVQIANHASDHVIDPATGSGDPHYASVGYSTHTAPGVGDAWIAGVDGQLALIDEWGRASRREGLRGTVTGERWAASWYRPRMGGVDVPGARVVALSILHQGIELRAHLVTAPPGWTVREGSFAVAGAQEPVAEGTAIRGDDVSVELTPLHGWTGSGVARFQGGNAFGEYSATPYLTAEPVAGLPTTYVSAHRLGRDSVGSVPVTIAVTADCLVATWDDGRRDEFVLGELFG
ncbi:conserved hypothetical protein [Catenulispora acidiphila DSM 44928]|uniref:DUF2264 domain-containing protein n=1 Tax=Catenulispora acidiphila (strain DSM 44928 / JCM 14897 / NBRC 102108 / NRRL B-24433 / ID139908) TaxID=479433 RepID=C7QBD7_CATAD|nr:DUF2264 domain-containing protein [Catenulispora acidiphila]ACU70514.1 conserved hypothetical protein [Catenulispora acidiphila DSM 44928]